MPIKSLTDNIRAELLLLLAHTVSPSTSSLARQVQMFSESSASHNIIDLDCYLQDVFIFGLHLKGCNAVKTKFLKRKLIYSNKIVIKQALRT